MNNLKQLIDNYINKYTQLLKKNKFEVSLEEAMYITTTNIVPEDFFDNNSNECDNDKDILYKKLDDIIVIFNDIENSTKIINYCEENNKICLYIGYIEYSSMLLAEILELLDGKMIEITGDGNYSIIEELNNKELKNLIEDLKDINYLSYDNILNLHFFEYDKKIKFLLEGVLSYFNAKINDFLERNNIGISFNMRIGVTKGDCIITRYKINDYLLQDKLIGSIVNQAAHQAMGK